MAVKAVQQDVETGLLFAVHITSAEVEKFRAARDELDSRSKVGYSAADVMEEAVRIGLQDLSKDSPI